MRVFITGGTGFIGNYLARGLAQEGFRVSVLTRNNSKRRVLPEGIDIVPGDPVTTGAWQEKIGESDSVINLAGASIFKRWNEKSKAIIRESRIETTRNIVKALVRIGKKNIDLISASAVGYYGYREDEVLVESSSAGSDFMAAVSRDWEAEALKARENGTRVVLCRFGIVLGTGGGALSKMLPFFRMGIGTRLGDGKQWFSWIHRKDLFRILLHLVKSKDIQGAVNCTAPRPVRNKVFTKTLGKVLRRPVFLPPLPGFLLRGVLGEFSDSVLKGQKVIPKVLMDKGFAFVFPDIEEALSNIVSSSYDTDPPPA